MNRNALNRSLLLALLTDAATLVLLLLVPNVIPAISEPSGTITFVFIAIYGAFLVGTFMLRKLQPIPPATGTWLSPAVRGVLAGLFGLVLTLILTWQLGFFESFPSAVPMVLGEGEAAAYFVFAPGAWLAVSMLYILFLAFPVNETVEPGDGRYTLFSLVGLITGGLMLASFVAQGRAFGPPSNPFLWLVVGLVLLLALFVPPRLLYISRYAEIRSREAAVLLVSLTIVAVVGAWLLAAGQAAVF